MLLTLYRKTYAKINLEAIRNNLETIQAHIGQQNKIIPVLKANAYGHGSVEVASFLEKHKYDFFAVALLEEALELRESGVKTPILILGWVHPDYAYLAIQHDFVLTVFQKEWLEKVGKLNLIGSLNIHIKADTGMGRNGLKNDIEMQELIGTLVKIPFINVTGIYTHFATADDEDSSFFYKQLSKWKQIYESVTKYYPAEQIITHIGNSASSIQYPNHMTTYTRVGVSIYGMYPSQYVKESAKINLQPALELKSEIIHVKKASVGDKIGYGCTYTADEESWIGTIAIGYADGWLRKLQGSDVLIEGKRMQIVGRICMDMLMVKLDQKYPIGTEVTLIGQSGNDFISVDEISNKLETINYEITTNLTDRVPRIYTD